MTGLNIKKEDILKNTLLNFKSKFEKIIFSRIYTH